MVRWSRNDSGSDFGKVLVPVPVPNNIFSVFQQQKIWTKFCLLNVRSSVADPNDVGAGPDPDFHFMIRILLVTLMRIRIWILPFTLMRILIIAAK
jgi:hypothetical protein